MFVIELVVVVEGRNPEVIERTTSPRHFVYDVHHRAKTLLRDARRRLPVPPNGYQILDQQGRVVARSWTATSA